MSLDQKSMGDFREVFLERKALCLRMGMGQVEFIIYRCVNELKYLRAHVRSPRNFSMA